jgi:uncharacterized protein (DUF39 family)
MAKTYEEINEKIRKKEAVVVTAEEIIDIVDEKGPAKAAKEVDVVTTGTFGPMCSSGIMFNVGHTRPKMKIEKAWLNGVRAYCGIAAVDCYLGAAELPDDDPRNKIFPGQFRYGGGHVIEDLISGRDVVFRASAYGTDCYPRKELETLLRLEDMNDAWLLNPRNSYQNYNVAVNRSSSRPIYTYLGTLRPNQANANYSSAGQLSPLLCDPYYRTIGTGTKIFLAGGNGYVIHSGTQHCPTEKRSDNGVPLGGAGTIAVIGDLKKARPEFLRGVSLAGYGVSLAVGIGVPIPVLDEETVKYAAVRDSEIMAPVIDYSEDYPQMKGEPLAYVSYAELRSGCITIDGRQIETASLSSYYKAREIATELKGWIEAGEFELGKPVELLPSAESGVEFRPLKYRPVEK